MTRHTRYFVLGMSGVLVIGLCSGLFAYFNRGAAAAVAATGPAELAYVPPDASIVAYANVRAVMLSDFRERLRQIAPGETGQDELEQRLGLSVERDVDHVLAFLAPGPEGAAPWRLALFRGRFDTARLETVARERGATVSDHGDTRVVSVDAGEGQAMAMAFMEPGLVAVGDLEAVLRALDRGTAGTDITSSGALMGLVEGVDPGSTAWAVGRLSALNAVPFLPDGMAAQIPALTAFAIEGRVNRDVSGSLSVDGRDDEAAEQLRDVVRGVLALARMQTAARPGLQALLDSLRLNGVGTTVTLSFAVPPDVFDALFAEAARVAAP